MDSPSWKVFMAIQPPTIELHKTLALAEKAKFGSVALVTLVVWNTYPLLPAVVYAWPQGIKPVTKEEIYVAPLSH